MQLLLTLSHHFHMFFPLAVLAHCIVQFSLILDVIKSDIERHPDIVGGGVTLDIGVLTPSLSSQSASELSWF